LQALQGFDGRIQVGQLLSKLLQRFRQICHGLARSRKKKG
jgi:hypothetical protein